MCKSLAIRCSLPCRVTSANVSCLESSLRHLPTHTIEVLEMKGDFISGAKGLEGGTRLNVRLVFKRRDRGETTVQVVMVRANENRDISFDVLNLKRYTCSQQCCIDVVYIQET